MSAEEPSFVDVIRRVVQEELRHAYAPFPGRVAVVNQSAQTADIVPFHAGMGMLRDVPLLVPGSTASAETIKVAAGDFVLCIPCMFSLDEWIGTDVRGPVEPADPRMRSLTDVLAIPIIRSPAPDAAARAADRAIEGTTVALGDATSADVLLKGNAAFQAAWSAGWTAIDTALALANTGGYLPAASAAFQAAKPALVPTTNTKAS